MNFEQAKTITGKLSLHVWLTRLLRSLLLVGMLAAATGAVFAPSFGLEADADHLWTMAIFFAGSWMVLSILGYRQIKTANQAAIYISTGRLDLAETQLRDAVLAFNMHPRGKLMACHNLAVVAHNQKNFMAAAELCRAIIQLSGRSLTEMVNLCRILLADCLLEIQQVEAADAAIRPLRVETRSLPLDQKLLLLPIQLRCDTARGEFQSVIDDLPSKMRHAEMLDAPKAGLCHALLSKACEKLNRGSEAAFLRERAELYHDIDFDELKIPLASPSAN